MIVGFHANCTDGMASAWVARKSGVPVDKIFPLEYGKPLPGAFYTSEEPVVFLDYRPPIEDLYDLMKLTQVYIIDHHKNAYEAARKELPRAFLWLDTPETYDKIREIQTDHVYFFDNDRSGATLAWEFFFWGQPVPLMLRLVTDYDLYRFALPQTRAFSTIAQVAPLSFDFFDKMYERTETDMDEVVIQGLAYGLMQNDCVDKLVASDAFRTTLFGEVVSGIPAVNSNLFQNELARKLMEQYDSDVACVFRVAPGGEVLYSLRGRNGYDVSVIARSFGGNGHKYAAGFSRHVLPDVMTDRSTKAEMADKLLRHEAFDRAALFAGMVDDSLAGHPYVINNPRLAQKAERVVEGLNDIYQEIGAHHDDDE